MRAPRADARACMPSLSAQRWVWSSPGSATRRPLGAAPLTITPSPRPRWPTRSGPAGRTNARAPAASLASRSTLPSQPARTWAPQPAGRAAAVRPPPPPPGRHTTKTRTLAALRTMALPCTTRARAPRHAAPPPRSRLTGPPQCRAPLPRSPNKPPRTLQTAHRARDTHSTDSALPLMEAAPFLPARHTGPSAPPTPTPTAATLRRHPRLPQLEARPWTRRQHSRT